MEIKYLSSCDVMLVVGYTVSFADLVLFEKTLTTNYNYKLLGSVGPLLFGLIWAKG